MANRTIGVYKSYNFIDKDPVIDIVRRIVELYGIEHSISFNAAMKKIAERSGVAYATMRNWFYGQVKRPQFCTVEAVARAANTSFIPDQYRRRFKVIDGGRKRA